jgi:hypothetical protein
MKVSFDDCYAELVEAAGAASRVTFENWEKRLGYAQVVQFVRTFSHERVFDLSPADVREVVLSTQHALGEVKKEQQIREVEDFTCPFALQHIFHNFVEKSGEVPTWQRFWRWMQVQARPYWLDPIQPLVDRLRTRYPGDRIDAAIQWRLGKFYYSALREVDLLVSMHARSVPLKYHVLADVLLRVDYWIDHTLICTYFPNSRYREAATGRKPPAAVFFADTGGLFSVVDFEVERQGFGKTWLISDRAKDRLAKLLTA